MANLIECPDCGKEISSRANACPHCGCPMGKIDAPKCPHCGSQNFHKISLKNKVGAGVAFGLFSVGHIAKTFKCDSCGHKW